MEVLSHRPAWFVLGPLIGLVVLALLALLNRRIGALGGYSAIVEEATARAPGLDWRFTFLAGIFGGALVWRLLAGSGNVGEGGYGWLSRAFDSDVVVVLALFAGGALIGFGAKTAGGCTSGNGLGACSAGSPAGFAATATFMGTAIIASFVIKGLT